MLGFIVGEKHDAADALDIAVGDSTILPVARASITHGTLAQRRCADSCCGQAIWTEVAAGS